ncbi:MAG: transporter, family, putative rane transport protein [Acidobacteriaceae bacterium]|jgi:predicted MFS family arabinose efflux permease|nr:transporter, family, putative rane transport protein [Acidobacteriaceae bacterium]
MSNSDDISSDRVHESAAPRLPLGEGASFASAALPVAAPRPLHPLHPLAGVVGVFVCGLVAFLTLYATQPLLPLFETLFHASKSAVGWTVSASTLGVAIAAPLLGTFTERMNRKRVILISILLLAVPTCAAATATSLGWLVFWRLLQGLITPGVFATTIAYITEAWPPTAVAPVMSIYVSGTALGGFSGRAVTGVMADHVGWRPSFMLLGLISLSGAALVAWLLPDRPSSHHADVRPPFRQIFTPMLGHLRNPRLLTTYLVGFNVLFSLVGVFTYITFYLAAAPFSLSTAKLSLLFVVYLVGLVATPLAGALLPRVGLRAGITGSILLSLLGVLLTLAHSLPVVVVGLALCCTGVFISQSCATSFLREAAPEASRASAVGMYVACYYIGGTVAGVAPSLVWKLGGWTACAAMVAIIDVVSIVVARSGWRDAVPV